MWHTAHLKNQSFRTRLVLAIGLVLFSLISLYFFFFIERLTAILNNGLMREGENLAKNVGFSSELGVLAGDPTFVDASIAGILEQRDVVFATVYNKDGQVIAAKSKIGEKPSLVAEEVKRMLEGRAVIMERVAFGGVEYDQFTSPIIIRTGGIPETGEAVGFSQVILSRDAVRAEQKNALALYGIISILIFFAAGIAVAYFTRRMTRSLDALLDGVQHIAAGSYGKRIHVEARDEFGRVATAFNKMAEGLAEARWHEEEVSRMKSEFLSIAAHQLRTPLTELKWMFTTVLEEEAGRAALQSEEKRMLDRGLEATRRMITLVNDLLNVVRIEEGRFGYRFSRVSLVDLTETVLDELGGLARKQGVTLTLNQPSSPLPHLLLDIHKLPLALTNVIENAIHYTLPGGTVEITFATGAGGAEMIVRDTGIGIPDDQTDRIFTKFFRASNAMRAQPNGSGLGLFIAKNILEKHGGSIAIASHEGTGTTVTLTFPLPT